METAAPYSSRRLHFRSQWYWALLLDYHDDKMILS